MAARHASVTVGLWAAFASLGFAQAPNPKAPTPVATATTQSVPDADGLKQTIAKSVEFLLSKQEAFDKDGPVAEWPYEGVYRVREPGKPGAMIPIGYRVGGTGIVGQALIEAPGLMDDAPRREALARSMAFVIASIRHPLMNPDYDGGYDVRGWGYTYGLLFLLRCEAAGIVPQDQIEGEKKACEFFVKAIQETAINEVGGWNYARQAGKDKVSPPSPFMTAPTLDALFEAKARGYAVDPAVVDKALATLERARTESGAVVYSGFASPRRSDPTPGAVGRMLASTGTLHLAGKASVADVRGALDAFIVHWPWLDQRRAKQGTHEGPYMIAPYYFYYAHRAAGRAIEMLPEQERAEYRRRVLQLLFSVRQEDGTWNDRVFHRSAGFGTASALLTILSPQMPAPATWESAKKAESPAKP
jgi:hypothetical protein